jgi:hypothetical protein
MLRGRIHRNVLVIRLQADLTVEFAVASVQVTAKFSECRVDCQCPCWSGVVAFEADGAAHPLCISSDQS